ncbi:MAG TPA: S53 family peptidase [Solirubrobacteraceae bacterium]|nr:S53 family peptidase [Solirubrobacteraceae bacterium]
MAAALLVIAAVPASARPFHVVVRHRFGAPPTSAQCEAVNSIACYNPPAFEQAYGLNPLYHAGLTGAGKTIVIVDAFGSPTAQDDLAQFDSDNGLPKPPTFDIIAPDGPIPAWDPSDSDMVGWAEETSLDIEYSHAIAPGANILLVETPVSETEGVTGLPQIVEAENYVVDHHLGDVISQSFGATEQTFPSPRSIYDLRSAVVNAAAHRVTVLGASGDAGSTDAELDTTDLFPLKVTSWPAADPLVTSVGGTQLHLDATGNRTAPDNVWNDSVLFGSPAAGGGGLSAVFDRPSYQDGERWIVGDHRGVPDVSMSAAVDGGANVYLGFTGDDDDSGTNDITPGYYTFGGTSAATPEFAGIVAIADQAAGHDVGLINPTLYAHASDHRFPGLTDITLGNNDPGTFTNAGPDDPGTFTVDGFDATRGYDLASGLGTPNGAATIADLVPRQGHRRGDHHKR